jgi:GTP-binding protein
MIIHNAKFVCSNTDVKKCPDEKRPEFAFIGRSNVGKSSLINMLTGYKGLAKISSKPGKTRLINHFIINDTWFLVDLPGYGYAKVSKTMLSEFGKTITQYVEKRTQLTCLFVLVDSRLEPQRIDLDFFRRLGELGVPFAIVQTKCDKLGKNVAENNLELLKNALLTEWEELPPIFQTSSEEKTGRTELLDYIEDIYNKTSIK